ncbi:response regulator [Glutamicibacter arilaitensis]|uniref:response regulator n=1 Tax=Glutamicibacter arilaitensis TaxID=256701 RepID=UPI00384FC260
MNEERSSPAIKTLVVDDDFAVAGLHRRYLAAMEGFEVVGMLERGSSVAPYLEKHQVDLVLLDVHLPDLTGLEVLEVVRALKMDVDIIMITADSERESVRKAVGHGVEDYLVKPFNVQDFRARLEAYAQRARRRSPNSAALGQLEVDRLLAAATGRAPAASGATVHLEAGAAPASDSTSLPKGFTAPTMALVSQALREALPKEDGAISAKELADACGISRVSARRYLDFLVERKLAELKPRYGAAGRPEHRYRWR